MCGATEVLTSQSHFLTRIDCILNFRILIFEIDVKIKFLKSSSTTKVNLIHIPNNSNLNFPGSKAMQKQCLQIVWRNRI
jgi:hypothetical protein